MMESRLNNDNDRIEVLEKQLREAKELAADSDRKYEEVSYWQKTKKLRKSEKFRLKIQTRALLFVFSP